MAEGKAVFHGKSILDEASRKNGKLDNSGPLAQPPKQPNTTRIQGPRHTRSISQVLKCPECHSTRLYKDGLRYLADGRTVQRWLCRECSYRFSDKKPLQNNLRWQINSPSAKDTKRRVCDSLTEASKNLTTVETRQEPAPREGTTNAEHIKGLLTQYLAWLEKEGYYGESRYPGLIRQLLNAGANLLDPESVKKTIAQQKWKNGTKILAVYAYDIMATKILKIGWTRPTYKQEETLPFIPEETEIDQLIASTRSKRMAAYLQTLKETFADPSEALRLQWIDFSQKNNAITINKPVKRHAPRQLQISNKLVLMLNALPHTSERIFPTTYRAVCKSFYRIKTRTANNTQNPRLRSISLTTFRHWGATMTYHYTKNILLVKTLLGHKKIENTMKYTQLVQFKDDEFDVATATTVEEAKELLATGFDYVTNFKDVKLFRKPKRLNG